MTKQRFTPADRMVVRITPYNESPLEAIFDLRGFDRVIVSLRETCNW